MSPTTLACLMATLEESKSSSEIITYARLDRIKFGIVRRDTIYKALIRLEAEKLIQKNIRDGSRVYTLSRYGWVALQSEYDRLDNLKEGLSKLFLKNS